MNKVSRFVFELILCENLVMFEQNLKNKYPFLTEYFEECIKNPSQNTSHSILFYGQDIHAQYELATEIARLLNCREFQNETCRCVNCNWVKNKQHPAVLTISKIDNKPSDDESKTVISVKQSQMIKNSLVNTSDYHRVFIFCDAEMKGENWVPKGLNKINFQEETANSLLKIIEEPPENTTFFFLTRDKDDLIETIISRSQSFFVPSFDKENDDFSHIKDVFADYPEIERQTCLDLAQSLSNLAKEQGSEKVLNEIQNYLLALLKNNLGNKVLQNKILSDIKSAELAKQQIENHIPPQLAFEGMILEFTK